MIWVWISAWGICFDEFAGIMGFLVRKMPKKLRNPIRNILHSLKYTKLNSKFFIKKPKGKISLTATLLIPVLRFKNWTLHFRCLTCTPDTISKNLFLLQFIGNLPYLNLQRNRKIKQSMKLVVEDSNFTVLTLYRFEALLRGGLG